MKIICKSFYQNIGEFSNSLFQEGPGCILRIILRIIILLNTDLCKSLYMSLNLSLSLYESSLHIPLENYNLGQNI